MNANIQFRATTWNQCGFEYTTKDSITLTINNKPLFYSEAPDQFEELAHAINAGTITRELVHGLFDPIAENPWFSCDWDVAIEDPYTEYAHYLVIQYSPQTGEYSTQEYKPVVDGLGIATGEYIVSGHAIASPDYLETLEPVAIPAVKESILALVRRDCMRG